MRPAVLRCNPSHALSSALLALVLGLALLPAGARAAPPTCTPPDHGTAANFEIDGNLRCADVVAPTVPGADWFDGVSPVCLSGILLSGAQCYQEKVPSPSTLFIQDPVTAGSLVDATTFSGMSNKNNDNIASGKKPWSIGPGNAPQKDDLTEIYVHLRTDACGQNWLMIGFAYRSTSGDKHADFEFLQAGANVTATQIIGLGPNNGRTGDGAGPGVDDFIIVVDYVNGGAEACIEVRAWDGDSYEPITPPPGLDCDLDGFPDPAKFSAVNQTAFTTDCTVFLNSSSGDTGNTYDVHQFAEAAVNLSAFGIDISQFPCVPTTNLLIKTRSSDSFTAELKDFGAGTFLFTEPPVASAGDDQAVCAPSGESRSFNLNGSCSSGSCEWTQISGPTVTFGDASACATTASFTGPGTAVLRLTCTVAGSEGCQADDDVNLTINADPVANAGEDQAQCAPSGESRSFNLTGTCSSGNCAWSQVSGPSVAFGDASACATTASFTGPGTAVLRLTCTTAAGCTDTDDVSLTLNADPVANAGEDQAKCAPSGQAASFDLSGSCSSGNCSWSHVSGPSVTFGDASLCATSASFSGPGTAVLRLTCTTAAGCTDTDDVSLTINADPVASAGADQEQCAPDGASRSFDLNGSCSSGNCAWSQVSGPAVTFGDDTDCTTTASFTGPGTAVLRLTCTTTAGCTDTDDVSLTLDANPVANAGADQAQCAPNGGAKTFDLSGTCSSGNCSWSRVSGPAVTFGDAGACATTATFTGPGTAVVRLTCTTTEGCVGTDDVSLRIDSNPTATAGPDQAQCAPSGESVAFSLSGSCSSGNCSWSQVSGPSVTLGDAGACATSASFAGPGTAVLRLTCTTAEGCVGTDDVSLTINPDPVANAGADQEQCAPGSAFDLSGSCSSGNCSWSQVSGPAVTFGSASACATTASFTGPGTAVVRLTCTTTAGCTDTDDVSLTINANPVLTLAKTDITCEGADGTITVTIVGGTGPFSCSLDGGAPGTCASGDVIGGLGAGSHTVTVTDSKGCQDEESVTIGLPQCGKIAPTATTCDDFVSGTAGDITEICYGVKSGKINNTAPGVFFYYTKVIAPSSSFTVSIVQTNNNASFPYFGVQQGNQLFLFDANCNKIGQGSETSPGQASITINGASVGQVFIISVKYSTATVVGTNAGPKPTVHYDFKTMIDAMVVDADPEGLDLRNCVGGSTTVASADLGMVFYRPSPNPFSDATRMTFAVSVGSERVEIGVYDLAGRRVRGLTSGVVDAGRHDVIWDGRDDSGLLVKHGMYFIHAVVGTQSRTMRVIYLR